MHHRTTTNFHFFFKLRINASLSIRLLIAFFGRKIQLKQIVMTDKSLRSFNVVVNFAVKTIRDQTELIIYEHYMLNKRFVWLYSFLSHTACKAPYLSIIVLSWCLSV
jgi:hypothetical protein